MEALACPNCEQLFRLSPDALGTTVQCCNCRQVFQVPGEIPPLAIACEIDGVDARRCPECGRTFAMQPAFAEKTIRCRGCKTPFRVAVTQRPALQSAQRGPRPRHDEPPCRIGPLPQPPRQPAPPSLGPPARSEPHSRGEVKPLLAVIAAALCIVFVLDAILDRGPDAPPIVVQDAEPPAPPAGPPPAPAAVLAVPVAPPSLPPAEPVQPDAPPARPVMQPFEPSDAAVDPLEGKPERGPRLELDDPVITSAPH